MPSPEAAGYVELHCHSCYSLRDGASTPLELLHRARDLGYATLALTDHDGLYGAVEFVKAAAEVGVRPIVGAEVTLTGGFHLTLLAEDRTGYANLCRMLSHAYLDHGKDTPEVTFEVLAGHTAGLIALSGCRQGEIARLAQAGQLREAERVARRYLEWFGRAHFFVELQHNLVQGDTARNAALVQLAEGLGLGYVATNDVHYHVRARHRLHDILVAIRHRTTLDASHRLRRANAEFYLKSPGQMARRFVRYPGAIRTSVEIAERCQFRLLHELDYQFPGDVSEGQTADGQLALLCRQALVRRYPPAIPVLHRKAEERLTEELRLIRKHQLAGFFLTYHRVLKLAGRIAQELRGRDPRLRPDEHPVGRGRGSSVGSIVCYLIGLSHVDPISNDLFLGRFLNEELPSVPDIDLDFPRDIREKLLEQVYDEFGADRVALVCTFATYQMRSAVRDVGKALGLPAVEIDKLAKSCDHWGSDELEAEMARLPEFRDRVDAPLWRDLIAQVKQLLDLPRHVSQHVGGIVLSATPLRAIVPVEPARMPGRLLCQWDKDSVDDARFVKIDFLALGMLSLVDECLTLIQERTGQRVDLGRIDRQDLGVFNQICDGDTMGLFQIESRAQIQTLPQTQPRNLDDLAVEVAIIRPGPIVGGAFHPYMEYRRRQRAGEEVNVEYAHASLEPVLKETLGVILYQDQVIQVAMALAGFSAGQADSLRRSMSRKRSREAMEAHWPAFQAGAAKNDVPEETARTVFDRLLGFSAYGFPKSHAVAFALLAYESAWLRRYYPTEYYCALFNNQPMGFYSLEVLVGDARRHDVEIVRPDVNLSLVKCRIEGESTIRLGFTHVKGIQEHTAAKIVEGRGCRVSGVGCEFSPAGGARGGVRYQGTKEDDGHAASATPTTSGTEAPKLADIVHLRPSPRPGVSASRYPPSPNTQHPTPNTPYRSLFDFVQRTSLAPRLVENLIAVGAFDDLGLTRRELLWQLGLFYRPAGAQAALPLPTDQDMVALSNYSAWEELRADYAILDLSPKHHPLGLLRKHLGTAIHNSKTIEDVPDGADVRVAGMVVCRQRPGTAKGVVFLLLEDEHGLLNVVIYPRTYDAHRNLIRREPFLVVDGRVQRRHGTINVVGQGFTPLWLLLGALTNKMLAPPSHDFY